MIFYVKNSVQVAGLTQNEIKGIKEYLTINNPLFNRRLELGLANWAVPSSLHYYKEIGSESLDVPVGSLPNIVKILADNGYKFTTEDIIDGRKTNPQPLFFSTLNFKGTLRDYQQEIVNTCMTKSLGVVEAMTGSGKTITFVALTLKRQEPTLILVNTIELANQVKEAFLKFTNIKEDHIGLLGNGEFKLRYINVGLHQTMSHLNDEQYKFLNDFLGMVIADEVHIVAAESYYNTMSRLEAKYKFGFSATPERDDGLTPVIHFATGPKIYTVAKERLVDVLIKPDVVFLNTTYFFPLMLSSEYGELISDLSDDVGRNEFIYKTWKDTYQNNYTIMLCSRQSQVLKLKEMIGDEAVYLISTMPKKERYNNMQLLKNKNKKVVISTYGLFSTGIDLPHFDTMFLCAPIKSTIKIRQSAGRLMRKAVGKTKATIIDFVDIRIDLLYHHYRTRKRVLDNL